MWLQGCQVELVTEVAVGMSRAERRVGICWKWIGAQSGEGMRRGCATFAVCLVAAEETVRVVPAEFVQMNENYWGFCPFDDDLACSWSLLNRWDM